MKLVLQVASGIFDLIARTGLTDFQQGMIIGGALMFFAGYFSVDPVRNFLNRHRTEKSKHA